MVVVIAVVVVLVVVDTVTVGDDSNSHGAATPNITKADIINDKTVFSMISELKLVIDKSACSEFWVGLGKKTCREKQLSMDLFWPLF